MSGKQQQMLNVPSSRREHRLTFDFQRTQSVIQRTKKLRSLTLKICTICLSTFYFGYCLVYMSTISIEQMTKQFGTLKITDDIRGFLYGILTVGGAVGAFVSPYSMNRCTRRNHLILLNCGALIVEGLIQYPSLVCLIVCRVFQGFFIGHFMTLVPAYISQLSPKDVVGNFKVFNQLFFCSGMLFAYVYGTILKKAGVSDDIQWRLVFAFNLLTILTSLLSCIFGFLPQSPKSYIRKAMKDEAIKVIKRYVKKSFVEDVFHEKLAQVNNQVKLVISPHKIRINYSKKAYFIGLLLPIMQPWTGINAITTQGGILLENDDFSFGYYVPIIFCAVLFASIFGAIYTSKVYGRKTILLAGGLGLGICDAFIGICYLFIKDVNWLGWVIMTLLIIYMMIYGATIGPVVWMYIPQIIPGQVVPIAATINMLSATACLMSSPFINTPGNYASYFTFSGITLLITLINLFGMKESKGLDRESIQKAYLGKISP